MRIGKFRLEEGDMTESHGWNAKECTKLHNGDHLT